MLVLLTSRHTVNDKVVQKVLDKAVFCCKIEKKPLPICWLEDFGRAVATLRQFKGVLQGRHHKK